MTRPGIARRLARLEQECALGCATCQTWWEVVLGDDAGNWSRPEVCPGCGRWVPVRVVTQIVGVPQDVL